MAKTEKIEERTKDFIKAVSYLISVGEVKNQTDIASRIGIKASKMTEIKMERQNIQPAEWEEFKKVFNWPRQNATDISVNTVDKDILIIELKESVDNLKAKDRLNTKLIKRIIQDLYDKGALIVDQEYEADLIRTLSEEKLDQ